MKSDVIIIGAGVLGATLAWQLSRRGLVAAVLEREAVPALHASGRNAGMIRALYRHPQLTDWTLRSIAAWPAEVHVSHFRRSGSLIIGRELPGHHAEIFQALSLQTATDKTLPAVYTPSDGLLDSGGYVQTLVKQARQQGANFHFNAEVVKLQRSNTWEVTTGSGEIFSAPLVVNAAGAWLNRFLPPGTRPIAAQAFARHLFLTTGWEKNFAPGAELNPALPASGFYWDEAHEFYLRDWSEQEKLVSICEKIPAEPETFTPAPATAAEISERLLSALPSAAPQIALGRSWHCFRTYTADQLPVLGPDPELPGLFWAVAFGGFGMSTSFAACEDAARYLAGESAALPPDFLPTRLKV